MFYPYNNFPLSKLYFPIFWQLFQNQLNTRTEPSVLVLILLTLKPYNFFPFRAKTLIFSNNSYNYIHNMPYKFQRSTYQTPDFLYLLEYYFMPVFV